MHPLGPIIHPWPDKMAQVGAGAERVETRREWVRAKEERLKRDRENQWLARVERGGMIH